MKTDKQKVKNKRDIKNEKKKQSNYQKKSIMNGKRKKFMTLKEKCKSRAGLEGNPGLWPWPKCQAPALTRQARKALLVTTLITPSFPFS